MNVFMLAAGLGSRLRPLTYKHPKPCVPFLNVPLGLYPFRFLSGLKISQLVVNTFHLPEQVVSLYKNQPFYKPEIKFSHENNIILGSAGGLKKASKLFDFSDSDNTILMLNSDEVLFKIDKTFLQKAYQKHLNEKNLATLVVMKHPEAGNKFGAIWCVDGRVQNIGKTSTSSDQQPYHFIGMIFLNEKILNLIPENTETNIFYDVLISHLKTEKVSTYEVECQWYETGNPVDFFAATETVLKNLDFDTHNFINSYDHSELYQIDDSTNLVSTKLLNQVQNLTGFNVVSKTAHPSLLKHLGSLHNSIVFENEILNENYFKV